MGTKDTVPDNNEADLQGPLMSHDLRAALADVVGGLQLMDATQLSGENKAQLERILAASEALVSLMDELTADLQDFTVRSDRAVPFLDLEEFLARVEKRWAGVARQKNIQFRLRIGPDLPRQVMLSDVALERILANVIENAFKHTSKGQVALSADLDPSGSLVFTVCDTGSGFAEDMIGELFKPSWRQVEFDKPGTGLGLRSVKRLLSRIGGEIALSNTSDGARVDIEIPNSSWQPRQADTGLDGKRSDASYMLSGLRFLLAEDNRTSQLVAVNMLKRLGADVTIVDNGQDALNAIEGQDFDVVLLDIEMPKKSGLEVIQAVRGRTDRKATLPLVALTAFVMEEHRTRITAAGADGTISKPVADRKHFGRAVNAILNRLPSFHKDRPRAEATFDALPFIDADVYHGLKRSIGDEAFFSILEKMELDLKDVRNNLSQAVEAGNMLGVRQASHVLISLAGAVGAERLMNSAQRINVLANEEDVSGVRQKVGRCSIDILRLIDFISDQRGRS